MNMITVLGASGFIGSHLVERLRELNLNCYCPDRNEDLSSKNLGKVIYCIGLTADFRSRPFDTVTAHVCKLVEILQECRFDSLLYLSSTRLYKSIQGTAKEEDEIRVNPLDDNELYNISKAMGESLTLACGKKARIARISNVYGNDFSSNNFLSAVIKEALHTKKVMLRTSFESAKDYISVDDVVDILIRIATQGRHRVYNLASGTNVSNLELMKRIGDITGCQFTVAPNAETMTFPKISIQRIKEEFNFVPPNVLNDIAKLVEVYRTQEGLQK